MSFSKPQQGHFRPLVSAAWSVRCRESGADPRDAAAKDAWYREQLLTCTGLPSTSALDGGADFDAAMQHFEALADAGTYWAQRAESGNFRRIIHAVFRGRPAVIDGDPVTPAYLCGIAQQALRLDSPPALRSLSKDHLKTIVRALNIHRRRREKP